jgi:subtilisin family serine protease
VGVAWEIKLLPLKVFPGGGKRNDPGFDFDVVKAIDYAISAGAKIINNSWAGKNFSLAVKEAITRTEKAGILFVAACANHNQDDNESDNDSSPRYPASYGNPNIIAVHSIDPNDDISIFSNFGRSSVHIGAPRASILSTAAGGGYETRSGTSQAAPHVSGAAALLWTLPENAGKSASEIKALVLGNARRVNSLAGRSVTGATLDVNFVSPGSGVASADLHAPSGRRVVQHGWVEIRETTGGRKVMFNGRSVEDNYGDTLPSLLRSMANEQLSIYRD